jgi:hypothetical protein
MPHGKHYGAAAVSFEPKPAKPRAYSLAIFFPELIRLGLQQAVGEDQEQAPEFASLPRGALQVPAAPIILHFGRSAGQIPRERQGGSPVEIATGP